MRTVDELIAQIPTDFAARPLWRYEAELLVIEITRLRAELAAEKETLRRIDHTLTVHGKLDANTPLHAAIRASNAAPPQPDSVDFTTPRRKVDLILTPHSRVAWNVILCTDQDGDRHEIMKDRWVDLPFAAPPQGEAFAKVRDMAIANAWTPPIGSVTGMTGGPGSAPPHVEPSAADTCKHCNHGHFDDQRYGCDVECVNGVLIDIDVASEGWQKDVSYPLAPCHLNFANEDQEPNDCQERLAAWAAPKEPSAAESEREAKLEGWDSYDQKVVVERIRATWPSATEARMVELAREAKYVELYGPVADCLLKLRDLVIEKFGGGK